MTGLFWTLLALVVGGALAYARASLTTFTVAMAALLVGASLMDAASQVAWLIFAAIAIPLNVKSLRQQYISKPLLNLFRKVLPDMSSTEKEALEAGTTWWEAELFRGAPDWSKMHQYPAPRLTAEEQAFLDGPVETVCRMTSDWEVTHELADLPPQVWQYLKDNKFFAMIIKKQYGGLEFSAYAQSRVLQKLVGTSAVLASTVGVPNSLGPGELLQHYGTKKQKDYYLPRLANGEEIPCFALTSPEAGSDAGSIPDYGVVCKGMWQGEEVLGMRVTWNKRYITLAPIATVLGLAFKLRDPDHLLGDKEELGITCALVPTDTKGVEIGRRHFPLNVPFQNGPTRGKGVFLPIDFIIGGQEMAGQGWRMLVECLSVGRGITLPSNSTGGAKTVALASGAYSRIRRQFKLPIGKMEGIQEPLARIGGNAYVMDAASTMTTGAIDLGEKPSVISAIVKYHLTERSRQVIGDAMDIHGGKGICMGPNNYLARGYQGSPIAITVEGANILTRNMIIYGQGAIRCHPYVLAQMNAAQLDDRRLAVAEFDKAMFGHVGFAISNLFRASWLGWTNGLIAAAPFKDKTRRYYQQASRISACLAFMSDVSMAVLGGDLKRRERISARLGDMLSQLYLTSATLKRFHDEGRQGTDMILVQWGAEDSLHQAEKALRNLLDNFPVRWLGRTLKFVLMPYGITNKAPSDKLDRRVAELLQQPSEARDRLGFGQYWTANDGNAVGKLEETLKLIIRAEPIMDRISAKRGRKVPFIWLDQIAEDALRDGIINDAEAQLLTEAEAGRLAAINVDDFDPSELMVKPSMGEPSSVTNAA